MALTKVTGQVIKNTTDVTVGVLTVTNTLAVGGTVSIGGTLTYEDVTNVDAVGLITARNGIVVGSGITLSKDGDIFATGVTTTGSLVSSGAISGTTGTFTGNVTISNSAPALLLTDTDNDSDFNIQASGGVLALNDSTNSATRLAITSDGKIGVNETSPGQRLTVGGDIQIGFNTPTDAGRQLNFNVNRGSAADTLANINWQWNSKFVAQIRGIAGSDTTNKDDAHLAFFTSSANNLSERARITSAGLFGIGTDSPDARLYVNGVSTANIITARAADSNGNSIINILSEGTTGNSRINFSDTAGTDGQVSYSHNDRAMIFAAAGTTEKVRIATDGVTLKNMGAGGGIAINALGTTSEYGLMVANANRPSENDILLGVGASWNGDSVAQIDFRAGLDTTNKDDGKIMFYTQTSSGGGLVERMRIDQNGKVIIAEGQLHSTRVLAKFGIDCQGLNIYDDITDVSNYGMAFYNDPTSNYANGIGFFNDDGQSCGGYIVHQDKGGSNVGDIIMATSGSANTPTPRLRILSNGNTLVGNYLGGGTNQPIVYFLSEDGNYPDAAGYLGLRISNGYSDASIRAYGNNQSWTHQKYYYTGGGSVATAGSITMSGGNSISYNTSSDYRLKENEVLISDGITRLKQLKPYKFNWKTDTSKKVDGFYAHEVSDIVPEAITGEKDAVVTQAMIDAGEIDEAIGTPVYQVMDHSKLVPLLTAALQELTTEVETLKTEVAALKG